MVAKKGHYVSSKVYLWNCARFLLNVPMLEPDMCKYIFCYFFISIHKTMNERG